MMRIQRNNFRGRGKERKQLLRTGLSSFKTAGHHKLYLSHALQGLQACPAAHIRLVLPPPNILHTCHCSPAQSSTPPYLQHPVDSCMALRYMGALGCWLPQHCGPCCIPHFSGGMQEKLGEAVRAPRFAAAKATGWW